MKILKPRVNDQVAESRAYLKAKINVRNLGNCESQNTETQDSLAMSQ